MDSNNKQSNEKEKINKNKLGNIFEKLKSDIILKKLFNNLKKKKLLEIIKYNKYSQQRLKLNNNDYKEYSELYSSIEIEIIPFKIRYGNYKIINYETQNALYYHIYLDNNTEEDKRNYLGKEEIIEKIKIKIDYQIKSFYKLFFYCNYIESINFKKFYRNNITNMSNMFYGCYSLKELNLSNFNTDNVTNMNSMFNSCE